MNHYGIYYTYLYQSAFNYNFCVIMFLNIYVISNFFYANDVYKQPNVLRQLEESFLFANQSTVIFNFTIHLYKRCKI